MYFDFPGNMKKCNSYVYLLIAGDYHAKNIITNCHFVLGEPGKKKKKRKKHSMKTNQPTNQPDLEISLQPRSRLQYLASFSKIWKHNMDPIARKIKLLQSFQQLNVNKNTSCSFPHVYVGENCGLNIVPRPQNLFKDCYSHTYEVRSNTHTFIVSTNGSTNGHVSIGTADWLHCEGRVIEGSKSPAKGAIRKHTAER